jgi:hypothetical protein
MLFIRDDTDPVRIEYWDGDAWQSATADRVDIPAGSKMLFIQNTVPTGWTLDVTANDRVIRVTSVGAEGGDTAGTWVISGLSVDPHKLEISEMPRHDHDIRGGGGGDNNRQYNSFGPDGSKNNDNVSGRNTEFEGDDGTHTHGLTSGGSWRPSYINALICIRD